MADVDLLMALALIPLGTLLAGPAHELTHYVSIWPVAEDVRLQRRGKTTLQIEYDLYDDPWRMRYADISNILPSIIGISALIVFLITSPFELTLETLWVVPSWVAYVIGGPGDYSFI
jgi:hypothetical protein